MTFDTFKRVRLAHLPTPLEPMPALSRRLGGPKIFIKRDDCTGLALGGNKTRKLEFLIADALDKGADTIVTIGATQSNHVRQTAAAAARTGLACEAILQDAVPGRDPEYQETGNVQLDHLFGAAVHRFPASTDRAQLLAEVGQAVKQRGGMPYLIPAGGSNGIGGLGYANCADELAEQARSSGITIDALVLATGSGGTQGGLVAGMLRHSKPMPIVGIAISGNAATTRPKVEAVATETATLLGSRGRIPEGAIEIVDGHIGAGYGQPTDEMIEAVTWVAQHEGILLDPVYSGKAMAGLFALAKSGRFSSTHSIVFLHTGGAPALFGYRPTFASRQAIATGT